MANLLDMSNIFLWGGIILVFLVSILIFYYIFKRRRQTRQPTVDLQSGWGPQQEVPIQETIEQAIAKRGQGEEAYRSYDYPPSGGQLSTIREVVVEVIRAMREEEEKQKFMDQPDLNKFLEKKILNDVWSQAVNMKYEFVKDVEVLGATVRVFVSNKKEEVEEPELVVEEDDSGPQPRAEVDAPILPKKQRVRRQITPPPYIPDEGEEDEEEGEEEYGEEDEEDLDRDEIINLKG